MVVKIDKKLKNLLEKNALAFATVSKRGYPHCITVSNLKVISKNRILIGNRYMVETVGNIQRNNKIALTIWSKDWRKKSVGYELQGTAKYFTSGKWKKLFEKKHKGTSIKIKGVILITIFKIKELI